MKIKRNYKHINRYLDKLSREIYVQPVDPGHTKQSKQVIEGWVRPLKLKTVLDVGCGQGVSIPHFETIGVKWSGVTLGEDFDTFSKVDKRVKKEDMHFLSNENNSVDLIFARHILEHSPMPLLALMEWHRVAKKYLIIIVPHDKNVIQGGRNHYYMLTPQLWEVLFVKAGWFVDIRDFSDDLEHRWRLIKNG